MGAESCKCRIGWDMGGAESFKHRIGWDMGGPESCKRRSGWDVGGCYIKGVRKRRRASS
ncbi:hypothetical protein GA0115252_17272 [Streptomyces sp. DfronAA-171]|nr:hypothetical protein GA0115252_17272 [Streptomyces sp. DfronAA-171]